MNKEGCSRIGIEQRRLIELGLNERNSLAEISRRIDFDVSSVRREILRNRRDDGTSASKKKGGNTCAHLHTCKVRSLCDNGCEKRPCRACRMPCQQMCSEFRPRTCKTVERAPFACNARGRYATCSSQRFKYPAESADERAIVTEVDTVLGRKASHRCILSLHRVDLRFQIHFLLGSKSKEAVKRALDWLEIRCGGPQEFRNLFGLPLCDRGTEFDDIDGTERSFSDPLQKRGHVYSADPSRPDQKGACEKTTWSCGRLRQRGPRLTR